MADTSDTDVTAAWDRLTALPRPSLKDLFADAGRDAAMVEEASALHARMRGLVAAIRGGTFGTVRHLIHSGIGGSALGPKLALDALARPDQADPDAGPAIAVEVVANI